MVDDVIRAIEDATRELEQLRGLGSTVAQGFNDGVGGPVKAAGEGSASSVPEEVAAQAAAVGAEIERAMELVSAAIGKLGEYRDFI